MNTERRIECLFIGNIMKCMTEMTNYISCVDFWGELLKMSLSVWVHACNGVHIAMLSKAQSLSTPLVAQKREQDHLTQKLHSESWPWLSYLNLNVNRLDHRSSSIAWNHIHGGSEFTGDCLKWLSTVKCGGCQLELIEQTKQKGEGMKCEVEIQVQKWERKYV